ncbi:hypothetical protein B0H17DRAFT_1141623 [Mycena rosella]|uniref:Uncharacterized protein n=1 Tax=Mycena rosella TaxID=1033263 RepID=A0AAD7CZR2_MYCRO|nr:hypothetical protein B0H17DRAFT_1141623 [Mycena rosella]
MVLTTVKSVVVDSGISVFYRAASPANKPGAPTTPPTSLSLILSLGRTVVERLRTNVVARQKIEIDGRGDVARDTSARVASLSTAHSGLLPNLFAMESTPAQHAGIFANPIALVTRIQHPPRYSCQTDSQSKAADSLVGLDEHGDVEVGFAYN